MITAAPVAAKRGGAATAALTEIEGRRVAWFRLDGGKHRGAIGPTEGQTIERTIRLALDAGIPVVGEIATSGADVSEGLASLVAWGRVARAMSDASGTVPVILSVVGPCVGGPALLLGLADHVVMTAEAYAYVNGPRAAAAFTGVETSHTDLGGPDVHANRSGVASMVVLDDAEAAGVVADLLSYLPSNHLDEPPFWPTDDPLDRPSKVAAGVVPERPTASYDVRTVIGDVCDVAFDPSVDRAEVVAAIEAREAARKELERSRIEMVRGYAETRGCRRRALLTYFGEPYEGVCGRCDTCDEGTSEAFGEEVVETPFETGTRVAHATFGEGQVIRTEGDSVVVLFDEGGYRSLSITAVLERGLLEAR